VDREGIGERLGEEIAQSQLRTQAALGARIRVAPSTINSYVKGRRMPEVSRWLEIVEALQTADLHYILTGERREGAADVLLGVLKDALGSTLSEADLLDRLTVYEDARREREGN